MLNFWSFTLQFHRRVRIQGRFLLAVNEWRTLFSKFNFQLWGENFINVALWLHKNNLGLVVEFLMNGVALRTVDFIKLLLETDVLVFICWMDDLIGKDDCFHSSDLLVKNYMLCVHFFNDISGIILKDVFEKGLVYLLINILLIILWEKRIIYIRH